MLSLISLPRIDSEKGTCTVYSASVTAVLSGSCATPPPNMPEKMSRKLPPRPPWCCAPPKSKSRKSKSTCHVDFDFRDFDFGGAQHQGGRGGSFRDIFSGMFGGGVAQEPLSTAVTDAEYTVQVPFSESIRGNEIKLNIQR